MVTLNYTYKPVPKSKITCGCGKVFYARKDARFCEACLKQHTRDYFQLWYEKNKERRALERKRPKITRPCVTCGKKVTGTAHKKKCEDCKREWRKAYCRKYYLEHKGVKK